MQQRPNQALDPVYTGWDKFLNGQKLARIRLSFTRDTRNRANIERQTVLSSVTEFAGFGVNWLQSKKLVRLNI